MINFNNCPGLKQTFQSVFSQTFRNFEYIVIDGASSDGSQDVINEFSSSINYWVSEADTGIYNAMNKGIVQAKGDYLLFLNSGDCLADENVLAVLTSNHHGEHLVYGNMMMQLESKRWMKRYPSTVFLSYLFEDSLPHSGALMISRRAFAGELAFYDESLKIVSDWKWIALAIFKYNYTYRHIDQVLALFDRNGISSKPENLKLLNDEKKLVLKECFPLFFEDMDDLLRSRNDYRLLLSSRYLKLCLGFKKLIRL